MRWLVVLALASTALAADYATRARQVIEQSAARDTGYGGIAAKLYLRQDAAWCSERLEKLLAEPITGDMFWMFPVAAIAELDRGQLTPRARQALRQAWKTYMPYRGDTENHWVLYYASLYLMTELYPDDGPDTWFNGKSSRENREEARGWLESWVALTTGRGQGEYDSPHYLAMFNIPVSFLAGWARDPNVRRRFSMMREYLMADYAPENLDGTYVGAQSRVYDRELLEKSANVANSYGWLWFGIEPHPEPVHGYAMWYVLAGGDAPPEILRKIATDRSKPYTQVERKRTRNRWRLAEALHGPVYKTTYVRREYAVSSDQGGVLQPIQQHSWDVTWALPDQRGRQNTLFFLNPHSSLRELQTYFVFTPDTGIADVVSSKKFYDSPDKFSGGSPFEKIVQDQDTIVALYNIPAGERFPHINGFFSKDLDEKREDPSGWIFLRGGDTYIACRPLQPYAWKPIDGGGQRLFSPHRRNGVVVQAAARSEFASLDAFRQAILALPLEFRLEPAPAVHFQSLRGTKIDFAYGEAPRINARAVDYEHWPLFGGPLLESSVDSHVLTIRYQGESRTLDFNTLTVR